MQLNPLSFSSLIPKMYKILSLQSLMISIFLLFSNR